MAFSKKASRRYRRSSRYRRRAWRRRYRRNRYRRRYRRYRRRNKPEYKRKEFRLTAQFSNRINALTVGNVTSNVSVVTPHYYDYIVLGAETVEGVPYCIPIKQGTNIDQRIGAKISPVGLRIFGTISIETKGQVFNTAIAGLDSVANVNGCMLRMIVMQVRNGNTTHSPLAKDFSPCNPNVVTALSQEQEVLNVDQYNGQDCTYFNDPEWFNKMFAFSNVYNRHVTREGQTVRVWDYLTSETRFKSGMYAKCPYRQGIGESMRILKDKLYYLNPTVAPTFAIRTKTKKPYRMVWKESRDQDNVLTANCKNPVYVILIPIFPEGMNQSRISAALNFQLFYTDT